MRDLPAELTTGPFLRSQALAVGVTSRMLDGRRFVRIHPRVYRLADYSMTHADWIQAARLVLPDHAHLTGITRIQDVGLDFGPRRPVRFVMEGDHHLAIDGIFLHRTKQLPPVTSDGVCIEAAFIAYCAKARVIDAIKVGDWLLHLEHMNLAALIELAYAHPWRDGAQEALWVSNHLNERSKSLMESELRSFLEFAGLPSPEVNATVDLGDSAVAEGDLVYRTWTTVVEYEGAQHQEVRAQYAADLDRYALYRDNGYHYVQITKEHMSSPKNAVRKVHRQLVRAGYDGPEPIFGDRWRVLFVDVRSLLGPRHVTGEAA
jgi:hypothetical protein